MSKPTMRWNPAAAAVRTAPTNPPAGPDRIVSLARRSAGAVSTPLDCITRRGTWGPRARCTCRR